MPRGQTRDGASFAAMPGSLQNEQMTRMATTKKKSLHNKTQPAAKRRMSRMPLPLSPMLCTLTREVIDSPEYLYEIKWDGYRIIASSDQGHIRMDSRGGLDYTSRYPTLVASLRKLGHDVVLDGEVVVFNEKGIPDFDALQNYNGHNTPLCYCVFDIVWLDGYDLSQLPLTDRKERLRNILSDDPAIRFSESYDDGPGLYKQMLKRNLEGVVAKRRDSPYVPGQRGENWLKTPTRKRQEFVIGGWAESDRGRAFRSLLFGAYEDGQLRWIGKSGGGYREKDMPGILAKLTSLETDHSPFVNKVLDTKGAVIHWVRPELVANFEFATWTRSGRIRKPATFLGFRNDKKAVQVVREVPVEATPGPNTRAKSKTRPSNIAEPNDRGSSDDYWAAINAQDKSDTANFPIDNCNIQLFDVDRRIWPKVSKGDLINYYHRVSEYLLPEIHDRPQSLHVKLHGATAPGLYLKDMQGMQPDCADIFADRRRHLAPGKRPVINYLVCNNEATLLWMINLGCIDVNPWTSRVDHILEPDYIVIDLDPSEPDITEASLAKLRNTAMAAKEVLQKLNLTSFVKTSGKTGMHFFIPCSGMDHPGARSIAANLCARIRDDVPDDATVEVSRERRDGKVFVDFSQNDYADTVAAAYSVRPFLMPLVSTPLAAREINSRLDPRKYTMKEMLRRLERIGDLFAPLGDKKIIAANNKLLKRL